MSLSDELAARDALIKELTAEKHAKVELAKKLYDNIFRHIIIDLEDIIHEASKKGEVKKLTADKHAKAELAKKLYSNIFRYLVLDLKDVIHEAGDKTELDAFDLDEKSASASVSEPKRTTAFKWRQIHLCRYDSVSIFKILCYHCHNQWEQWATNPYNLHPIWYAFVMVILVVWIIGSVVVGYYEAEPDTGSLRMARMFRAILGSIPPMVQLLLFMFPPLYVQF